MQFSKACRIFIQGNWKKKGAIKTKASEKKGKITFSITGLASIVIHDYRRETIEIFNRSVTDQTVTPAEMCGIMTRYGLVETELPDVMGGQAIINIRDIPPGQEIDPDNVPLAFLWIAVGIPIDEIPYYRDSVITVTKFLDDSHVSLCFLVN
jgi:hypothetical protein